ncbi:MAG: HAD-IA family hydrolase [Alphaproteobacteria bacterium]|nr:HAD-IA family hydrolase [Alphaproteobacteria bacterium]
MSEIKAKPTVVIWDMGGIIYGFFAEAIVDRAKQEGWPLEKLPLGPTGIAPDPDYDALDRGGISEPEYVKRLASMLAQNGIAYKPYEDITLATQERPRTWEFIKQLKKAGLRQMLLTNDATAWLGENWWETWPLSSLFDAIVDVKNVGIRKPAPEPYLACTNELGVKPEDCLFIDDMRVNCKGAEAVGMQSYWYDIRDHQLSLAGVRRVLGL